MAEAKVLGRVLLISCGDYDDSTTYNNLDWVRYNGKSWVCKKDNTFGVTPEVGDDWAILAQDGSGFGDMEKRIYDANDDGIVDNAENASNLKNDAGQTVSANEIIEKTSVIETIPPMISDAFGAKGSNYVAGDYCIKDNKLYKANGATSYQTFNPTNWNEVSVADEISALNNKLNQNIIDVNNINTKTEIKRITIGNITFKAREGSIVSFARIDGANVLGYQAMVDILGNVVIISGNKPTYHSLTFANDILTITSTNNTACTVRLDY